MFWNKEREKLINDIEQLKREITSLFDRQNHSEYVFERIIDILQFNRDGYYVYVKQPEYMFDYPSRVIIDFVQSGHLHNCEITFDQYSIDKVITARTVFKRKDKIRIEVTLRVLDAFNQSRSEVKTLDILTDKDICVEVE